MNKPATIMCCILCMFPISCFGTLWEYSISGTGISVEPAIGIPHPITDSVPILVSDYNFHNGSGDWQGFAGYDYYSNNLDGSPYSYSSVSDFEELFELAPIINMPMYWAYGNNGSYYGEIWLTKQNENPASVPEPTTLLLFGTGLIWITAYHKKHKAKRESTLLDKPKKTQMGISPNNGNKGGRS